MKNFFKRIYNKFFKKNNHNVKLETSTQITPRINPFQKNIDDIYTEFYGCQNEILKNLNKLLNIEIKKHICKHLDKNIVNFNQIFSIKKYQDLINIIERFDQYQQLQEFICTYARKITDINQKTNFNEKVELLGNLLELLQKNSSLTPSFLQNEKNSFIQPLTTDHLKTTISNIESLNIAQKKIEFITKTVQNYYNKLLSLNIKVQQISACKNARANQK